MTGMFVEIFKNNPKSYQYRCGTGIFWALKVTKEMHAIDWCSVCSVILMRTNCHSKSRDGQRTKKGSKTYHDLSDTPSVTKIQNLNPEATTSIPDKSRMGIIPLIRGSYKKVCNTSIKLRVIPGGGVLVSSFAGYRPMASQNPYPIIVYSVASYRPHLSHFWVNVIVISRTEFDASRLLNIKTTAGTIFQPRMFLFLNPCLEEFSYRKNPENLRPHSSNSTKNVTPLLSVQLWKCDPIQRHIPSSLLLGSTPPPPGQWCKHNCYKLEV